MKRRLFLQSPLFAAPLTLQAQPQPVDRPKKAFKVAAGEDRFNDSITTDPGNPGGTMDCKDLW